MPRQNTNKNIPVIKPVVITKNTLVEPNAYPPIIITKNNNTLLGSIKEGFGFGIGSTIARNLFSRNTVPHATNVKEVSCVEYKKCLESNDKYECFGNLDMKEYVECRTKD
jgi:hypothetical protein